jgi:hypothetical protein
MTRDRALALVPAVLGILTEHIRQDQDLRTQLVDLIRGEIHDIQRQALSELHLVETDEPPGLSGNQPQTQTKRE